MTVKRTTIEGKTASLFYDEFMKWNADGWVIKDGLAGIHIGTRKEKSEPDCFSGHTYTEEVKYYWAEIEKTSG